MTCFDSLSFPLQERADMDVYRKPNARAAWEDTQHGLYSNEALFHLQVMNWDFFFHLAICGSS